MTTNLQSRVLYYNWLAAPNVFNRDIYNSNSPFVSIKLSNNNNNKKKKKRDNKSHRRENFVIVKPFLFPLCGQVLTKPTPKTLVRQPRDLGTSNADQARQFASILTHI